MFLKALPLCLLTFLLCTATVHSLTVEEVLTLKKAGVTDKTIQMLLKLEQEETLVDERLGIFKNRYGRIIYTTPIGSQECHQDHYPLYFYPYVEHSRHGGADHY